LGVWDATVQSCLMDVLVLQEDGETIIRRPEYEDFKAQAICTIIAARDAGMQPFYLDVTNGNRHHILYSVQDSIYLCTNSATPAR
jgi:hypothetical protein